ncbi:MAG: SDR family NAD(P)-dependent oxidoreductase [Desulfatiglans sp.]|nr:SDR family NAD(P)-dependent oxidoreductase [Desulfatiglans sp.]
MKEIRGKTAFITGGGSGIGLGMAKAFTQAGVKVVIADLRQDHLDEAVRYLGNKGDAVHPILLDVTDREGFEKAAIEAEKVFGPVSILCNNAGVNIIRAMDQASYSDWDWLMAVNLGGVFNGLMTFIPRLKMLGSGHIVNTSSIAGIVAGPGNGIYSATKFAIRGLSESLRYDLAPFGIGVSVLCPGTVATNLHQSEENRLKRFDGSMDDVTGKTRAFTGHVFREVLPTGMNPFEVGTKVLKGIERNDFYILPHPEFKDEFQESFDEIINALPHEPFDPIREVHEEKRRQSRRDARSRANELK